MEAIAERRTGCALGYVVAEKRDFHVVEPL